MAKGITICAGIDTGKYKLDIALEGASEQLQVDNTLADHNVLADWLRRHRGKRVGIEASGGYEQAGVAGLRRRRVGGGSCCSFSSRRRCAPMRSFACNGPRMTRSMPL